MRGPLNKLVSRSLSVASKWQQQQLRRLNIHEYQIEYFGMICWFWRTPVAVISQQLVQPFAYLGLNLTLPTAARSLCAFIAPAVAGSGIPEVKAYLNAIDAHSFLALSTLFVKRPPIVGILTRHDFMPEHILGLYPHIKPHK